jgi:hypothetical protein
MPEPVNHRNGRVRVHTRDTLKTTATQALSVDVYSTILQKLVENSAVLGAGATLVTTQTGEDLIIPKDTAPLILWAWFSLANKGSSNGEFPACDRCAGSCEKWAEE